MPKATGEVAGAVIGDAMYLAGEDNTETFKFDFKTNKWSTVASRIHAGNHNSAHVIDGLWYIVGGIDANSYGTVQIYNTKTDTWKEGKTMPWDGGSVCSAYIDGYIYACGGVQGFEDGHRRGGTNTTAQCGKYDVATNSWTYMKSMPYGRNHAATTSEGEKMWVFGGRMGRNVPSNGFNTVQVYDPKTDKWETSEDPDSKLKPFPQERGGMGTARYAKNANGVGEFYIFGGETETGKNATSNFVYSRVDIYNPSTNSWRSGKNMPLPRHGIYPLLYQGKLYIGGGGIHHGYSTTDHFDAYCI